MVEELSAATRRPHKSIFVLSLTDSGLIELTFIERTFMEQQGLLHPFHPVQQPLFLIFIFYSSINSQIRLENATGSAIGIPSISNA